jgi:hypothetical protein
MQAAGGHACRYPTALAEVTSVSGCGAWHSNWDRRVQSGVRGRAEPRTQLAVQGRTQLAAELGSQAGTHCRARRAIHCRADRGIGFRTDGGCDFLGQGEIDGRDEPGDQAATESRAKSWNDRHIDGGSERGLEPRSHPRIDPPIGSSRAGTNAGSWGAGLSTNCRGREDSYVVFRGVERIYIQGVM